ncbi:hypothetical protein MHYP_G00027410 [Metynnis hypsauchen]
MKANCWTGTARLCHAVDQRELLLPVWIHYTRTPLKSLYKMVKKSSQHRWRAFNESHQHQRSLCGAVSDKSIPALATAK